MAIAETGMGSLKFVTNELGMAKKTERSMSWLGRYGVRRLLDDYESRQLALPLEIPEGFEGAE